jgi:hypothetical protein
MFSCMKDASTGARVWRQTTVVATDTPPSVTQQNIPSSRIGGLSCWVLWCWESTALMSENSDEWSMRLRLKLVSWWRRAVWPAQESSSQGNASSSEARQGVCLDPEGGGALSSVCRCITQGQLGYPASSSPREGDIMSMSNLTAHRLKISDSY